MADKSKDGTTREERLASALRDNLKRRKVQARQRVAGTVEQNPLLQSGDEPSAEKAKDEDER